MKLISQRIKIIIRNEIYFKLIENILIEHFKILLYFECVLFIMFYHFSDGIFVTEVLQTYVCNIKLMLLKFN